MLESICQYQAFGKLIDTSSKAIECVSGAASLDLLIVEAW